MVAYLKIMDTKVTVNSKPLNKGKQQKKQPRRQPSKNKKQIAKFRPVRGTKSKSAPLAEGYTRIYRQPVTKTTKTGIIVSHKEYMGSLTSSDDLTFAQLRINPSDPVTFPWLSTIAGAYEKFKIRKMKITYMKNCASVTPGYVYMYPDYNVQRPAMDTETLFLNTMDVVETSPWVTAVLQIQPSKLNQLKSYLVRSPYRTYTDYLLYDPLNIYIGTAQSLANDPINIGRVFIEYEIELTIPDPESNLRLYNLDLHLSGVVTSTAGAGGNYLPNFSTGAKAPICGNYPLAMLPNGFQFPDYFCGLIQLWIIGSGFDAGRVPHMEAVNGSKTDDGFVINDTTLGTDIWAVTYWVNMDKNGTLIWANDASLVTSNSATVTYYIEMASANPRWWNQPDPKILSGFGHTNMSLGINIKQPVRDFVPKIAHLKKLLKFSSKKKRIIEMEDSD